MNIDKNVSFPTRIRAANMLHSVWREMDRRTVVSRVAKRNLMGQFLSWAFMSIPIHSNWPKGLFVYHRFKSIDIIHGGSKMHYRPLRSSLLPHTGKFRFLERASSPP
ncbi:hypothetical protein AVEN_215651-1 [Araneus ventricosus]|uniref:Uncharacterized protein n=1 Tax=Araneus ventricosus TaxID=182803 RepID=A0A4Y2VVJ4_ARAVE|nr:hypothetical protein AVEN_232278-1 [Araneus ventricosus]GBO28708.1 hypothetical protein AVEN_24075-1 [Araneus ventricosus]GBO28709.1 hypothetical protein AVEN_69584-1 [Araneus ventricosus]GBO28712.1 hypothetical protein AVEN_215651-1 [Araneus ventricosus]